MNIVFLKNCVGLNVVGFKTDVTCCCFFCVVLFAEPCGDRQRFFFIDLNLH